MVIMRKPVPGKAMVGVEFEAPPYPVQEASQFHMPDVQSSLYSVDADESSSAKVWDSPATNSQYNAQLPVLHTEPVINPPKLPENFAIGPEGGGTPKLSQEAIGSSTEFASPYCVNQRTGHATLDGERSSASVWSGSHRTDGAPPSAPPPPPPPVTSHESGDSQSLSQPPYPELSSNPWQPAFDGHRPSSPQHSVLKHKVSLITGQDLSSASLTRGPSPTLEGSGADVQYDDKLNPDDFDDIATAAWDEEVFDEGDPQLAPALSEASTSQVRSESETLSEEPEHPVAHAHIPQQKNPIQEGYSISQLRIVPQASSSRRETSNLFKNESTTTDREQHGMILDSHYEGQEEVPPPLPPRRSEGQRPIPPPRTPTESQPSTLPTRSADPEMQEQSKETYEIKKISWHDTNAPKNPRITPILIQNANGPCPLLALVNALTLSTPAKVETALIETLRSREQVSLGLLLDAVFEELMSGRRGDAAQGLPDVGDLYAFLLTLHTGMNVNPRFVPSSRNRSLSVEHACPGTFEETREMKLYSTFNIPLIHGWLPERESLAFRALSRNAVSYEDAQNLMLREEQLLGKLGEGGAESLNIEEQIILEDISTINAFFMTSATQLTPCGLLAITRSMAPGSIAILFRNDHFSTLYRHPRTHVLLQLVTDMGYAGHEDVVWESLNDVNGENAEFFSGDFRVVGEASSTSSTPSDSASKNRICRQNGTMAGTSNSDPLMPSGPDNEREDHDLALALQLQEEEEEARRRHSQLSQQYIEQQSASGSRNVPIPPRAGSRRDIQPRLRQDSRGTITSSPPFIPPRRNGATTPPVDLEAGVRAPPPCYEEALEQDPFVPQVDDPQHPSAMIDQAARSNNTNVAPVLLSSSRQTIPMTGTTDRLRGRRQTHLSGRGMYSHNQAYDKDRECSLM